MACLKRFPIDQVKIDRTFVRDIAGEGEDEPIIATAIVAIAHSLGLSAMAEGVETERQFLRAAGCDVMQGFCFSRLLPADQITACLRERRAGGA